VKPARTEAAGCPLKLKRVGKNDRVQNIANGPAVDFGRRRTRRRKGFGRERRRHQQIVFGEIPRSQSLKVVRTRSAQRPSNLVPIQLCAH